jgi:DMSO/TMAO reductase YedYZ molybdopterin-dependent catalytic subunit
VLSAGPTPHVPTERWDFRVLGVKGDTLARWNWDQFRALPEETISCDIHCVTKWSKLDMTWQGVSLDVLLEGLTLDAAYALIFAEGDYSANLPVADVTGGKAWIATGYDGHDLEPEHGGPARMLVPHLYFWKSAKWVRGLRFLERDEPGFWERLGYNNYGDPWREQRYWGD